MIQRAVIQKKVCMLGAFAVGKTSLVARFVTSIFSEKYLTTIGVKIEKKTIAVGATDVNLIVWDLHGEDDFQRTRISYLRGSSGYILVADGTRRVTLDLAIALQLGAEDAIGKVPFVLALNKSDVAAGWEIEEPAVDQLIRMGWMVVRTSAKTGQGVEQAFRALGERILEG